MDFSFMGGNEFGTDQIFAHNPVNYNDNDIFMTQPKIKKQLMWPVPKHRYPDPAVVPRFSVPPPQREEGFVDQYGNYPQITENMLIILLLVILIVMCTMIYSTVKQTCETLKLMASILASSPISD
jgi:hypothetical protein